MKRAFHLSYSRLVNPSQISLTRLCSTNTIVSTQLSTPSSKSFVSLDTLSKTNSAVNTAVVTNISTTTKVSNTSTADEERVLMNLRRVIRSDIVSWRKAVADEMQKPLYGVLQNRQIDAILTLMPVTVSDMEKIPTIGPKTMSYAKTIVDMINKRIAAFPPIKIKRMASDEYKKIINDTNC